MGVSKNVQSVPDFCATVDNGLIHNVKVHTPIKLANHSETTGKNMTIFFKATTKLESIASINGAM